MLQLPPPKSRESSPSEQGLPEHAALAVIRAVVEGIDTRVAVERFAPTLLNGGVTARAVVGRIRRQLQKEALERQRPDLAAVFAGIRTGQGRCRPAKLSEAILELQSTIKRAPLITDAVEAWLPPRVAAALGSAGYKTLAVLTLKAQGRRMWWSSVPGVGKAGARSIERLFHENPELTERARALVAENEKEAAVRPLEAIEVPTEVDGSQGIYRGPPALCTLSATNDYEALQAWLGLHEAQLTQRAYRKEAERLFLWAVVERRKALSSLTAEDAVHYRAFLRRPTPRNTWVGPSQHRDRPEWRPFAGPLSPNSVRYALSVLNALFRWLNEQRYLIANPFAGLKVRGASGAVPFDRARYFTQTEWALIRVVADGLEHSYKWSSDAANRVRFLLDFERGTGLRATELTSSTLDNIAIEASDHWWLDLAGKGAKEGRVALPPLTRQALIRYLLQRGLPTSPDLWVPGTPIVDSLQQSKNGITSARVRNILDRYFETAASVVEAQNPAFAVKLRRASTHWLRHTHATHALENGVKLTSVRDNLRHATIATTSTYLHADEAERARALAEAFKLT